MFGAVASSGQGWSQQSPMLPRWWQWRRYHILHILSAGCATPMPRVCPLFTLCQALLSPAMPAHDTLRWVKALLTVSGRGRHGAPSLGRHAAPAVGPTPNAGSMGQGGSVLPEVLNQFWSRAGTETENHLNLSPSSYTGVLNVYYLCRAV